MILSVLVGILVLVLNKIIKLINSGGFFKLSFWCIFVFWSSVNIEIYIGVIFMLSVFLFLLCGVIN